MADPVATWIGLRPTNTDRRATDSPLGRLGFRSTTRLVPTRGGLRPRPRVQISRAPAGTISSPALQARRRPPTTILKVLQRESDPTAIRVEATERWLPVAQSGRPMSGPQTSRTFLQREVFR